MAESINIRKALQQDLPRIVDIYNESVPTRLATADLFPVTVEAREDWFLEHQDEQHPLLVAEYGGASGAVVGWGCLGVFFNGRPAYDGAAEITVYVALDYAGKGIGGRLVDDLIGRCPKLKIKTLTAFIFGHNAASLTLFKRRGFAEWGRLPRIADMDGAERDLVILGRRLGE